MCIAAAIAGSTIVGGVISADAQRSASNKASDAQSASAQAQIGESRRQFDEIRKLLEPYTTAGTGALSQQQALLGLSGAGAQRSAISALEQSPQMQALTQQGENAIRQNASATGGLRGGNIQAALAQFRPQILSSMIENQYSKLGGLTSIGQNAAAGVGNAGMNASNQVNQALGNIGSAQAGAALASGQAQAGFANTLGQVGGFVGSRLFGGSGITPSAGSVDAYNSIGNVQFGAGDTSGLGFGF